MVYCGEETFQLGKASLFAGPDIPHLLAGGLNLDIYACRECKKVEFFMADNNLINKADSLDNAPQIAQVTCPKCKETHDIDYPNCPFCGFRY